MKKTYVVQLFIDAIVMILGVCLFIFPLANGINANDVFYVSFMIYALLELCEYILDHTRREPLCVFFSAAAASFSAAFLNNLDPAYVLSITIIVWILTYAIIKMISLEEIVKTKGNLFIIRLGTMSMLVLLGILISINIYFRISTLNYMLALLFLSYGTTEAFCDFLTYVSDEDKFLKE